MVQDQPVAKNKTPIVIYVPGLGSGQANSADRVADVVASVIDRQDPANRYNTKTSTEVSAPRGLAVGKTVVAAASNQPVLQFFQFDYASALEATQGTAVPGVVPGMVRSAALAVWAGVQWFFAATRSSKTARTKLQLALGLVTALALLFAALVALYALLAALGVDIPWISTVLGSQDQAATWTFGVTSLGLTITWAALRKKILALAEVAERLIRFTTNIESTADTISVRLDQAIDELRAGEWQGPLHLLGYSFGSLVLFEAMYPRINSGLSAKPVDTVSSMVTIACPLDLVRLYEPSYVDGRRPLRKDLSWTNVFNGADIFASNLKDKTDCEEHGATMVVGAETATATSIRYTDETIAAFQIFMSGRTHSSYWGEATEASCFDRLVDGGWLTNL